MSGGPCVKRLDTELANCNVQRQAYHGKAFIGNHVNKMLKVFQQSHKHKFRNKCIDCLN